MYNYSAFEPELKKTLIYLGITPNYRGYDYIVLAMQLVFENPERLQYVTKELYPVIAEKYNTDWRAVEHSIRITISRSWERDSALFAKILGAWVTERPAVGRILAVLYTYLLIEFEKDVI